MRVGYKIAIWVGLLYVMASVFIVSFVNHTLKKDALSHAEELSEVILKRNLATHAYLNNHLKPKVFELMKSVSSPDYFDPVWMSSTFAVREIDNAFKSSTGRKYYYKECAINARSPQNEADDFERHFIHELNDKPTRDKLSQIRSIDGKPFYAVLIKGETMESMCLRCHSTPDRAPKGLVAEYGGIRSFNRRAGDVVSAVSIRIPLAEAYADADKISMELSLIFLFVMGCFFAAHMYITKNLIINPLNAVKESALQIVTEEKNLGKTIPEPSELELKELTSAFNRMSAKLRYHLDNLDSLVRLRTGELDRTNQLLAGDIEKRKAVEAEREKLILELTEALEKIKQLKGLLPICMRCKKIRDEKGYWQQLEAYISEHSEAEFSHGICDGCLKELYPRHAKQILDRRQKSPE